MGRRLLVGNKTHSLATYVPVVEGLLVGSLVSPEHFLPVGERLLCPPACELEQTISQLRRIIGDDAVGTGNATLLKGTHDYV
jgi:hypothetical protein